MFFCALKSSKFTMLPQRGSVLKIIPVIVNSFLKLTCRKHWKELSLCRKTFFTKVNRSWDVSQNRNCGRHLAFWQCCQGVIDGDFYQAPYRNILLSLCIDNATLPVASNDFAWHSSSVNGLIVTEQLRCGLTNQYLNGTVRPWAQQLLLLIFQAKFVIFHYVSLVPVYYLSFHPKNWLLLKLLRILTNINVINSLLLNYVSEIVLEFD